MHTQSGNGAGYAARPDSSMPWPAWTARACSLPVLCLNAFKEWSFMAVFIFKVNVNWMYCIVPDECYCECFHSGVCERRSRKVLLRSWEYQISIEPSRRKPATTHRKQVITCSIKSPNLATPATIESHRRMCHQTAKQGGKKQMNAAAIPRTLPWRLVKNWFISELQYIFSQFSIDSENPLNQFRQVAAPDHRLSLAEHHSVPTSSSWKRLPVQLVSPWPLHRMPVGRLQVERGVHCQRFTPSHLARGRRDHGYVYVMAHKNVSCSPRNNGTFSS